MICYECKGRRVCPICKGRGEVEWGTEPSGMPMITKGAPGSRKYVECPRCHGARYCQTCDGTGKVD